MLHGLFNEIKNYKGINKDLDEAIDFLTSNDLNSLSVGANKITDKIVITKLVYKGKEKENAIPELHKNHLDMQIVLKGQEKVFFDFYNEKFEESIHTPYNEVKDVVKYKVELNNELVMNTNSFTMFFPSDVHQPSVKIDDEEITKLVIKVEL